ncbi:thiol-disulfide oxidoreductase DCC family protein [Paenibacillus dendritiformis]|uniref:Thiol-disulfide oxidoreductase DCC n=1 Tax=Paenibacillus dendritiformis C454 TaxID=1131935 RepID=H3SBY5_9BACL|nr:DCC1-like thiol-disulfide oxidoreductase family protein [Paenibacillus dendritiformis]EHQ63499.1 thiol-disulfide oxidoreductase DCC [Paenibacillus dendritiformis C454]CAH8771246.1 DCC1-like thiol-disulfide oxidoreductase family protein [Paenibacillus dendritiformis]
MTSRLSNSRQPVLLLMDGECLLCHSLTRFMIKRDAKRRFRFAALQSEAGRYVLERAGRSGRLPDSFVMVQGAACYTKSEAALRVCREVGGLWRLLYGCIAVPAPVRDWAYDFIAARRYRWFGRRGACLLSVPEMMDRWIETVEEVGARCEGSRST